MTSIEPVTVTTEDGCHLEGELARADAARAGMALCHPHPQYGGSMRSIVISALFGALPASRVSCLRFNFRGVEGSDGFYDEGKGERLDTRAAVSALSATLDPSVPLVLTGWSFGADVALSCVEARLAAWVAIAPPLRFSDGLSAGADPRPKLLVLAEHDEVRAPAEVEAIVASWSGATVTVVGGASHFFVGRTDTLVDHVQRFVDQMG